MRETSGIPGLDTLIDGGFPRHRTTLLLGDVGTGKTTFGLQFLMAGIRRGEAGLFVSVDQKPQHLIADATRLGWDLDGAMARGLITVLDASPAFTALKADGVLDARLVSSDLAEHICRVSARRLVVDGATSLVPFGAPPAQVDDFMRSLVASLDDNLGCTSLLTVQTADRSHTSAAGPIAERVAAGVIELQVMTRGDRSRRVLTVHKMRGTGVAQDTHAFTITDGLGLSLDVVHEPNAVQIA